jgi:uncharacterized protein
MATESKNTIVTTQKQDLWLFFAIAYAFSWLFWIPDALARNGVPIPSAIVEFLASPFNPAAFGPLVAAIVLTFRKERLVGVINLLKRGLDFRFKKVWLVPIFGLPLLVNGGAVLLATLSGWAKLDLANLSNPIDLPIIFVYILFLAGPFEEEFGWRGYALDRLQARFNALTSSIILGVFWTMWHLPAVFSNRLPVEPQLFWVWGILIVLWSILFTWIYNNTGRSILSVLLFHTMHNFSTYLMNPTMKLSPAIIGYSILLSLVAVAIVLRIQGRSQKEVSRTVQ